MHIPQPRQLLVTAVGGGLLVAASLSVALAGPAAAASPTPLPTATPSTPLAAPSSAATVAPSALPTAPGSSDPDIEVPAGNAGTTKSDDGITTVDVGLLFAAGLALAGGGTLTIVRRRR